MNSLISKGVLIEAIKQRMKLHEKNSENLTDENFQCDGEELFLRLADEDLAIIELIDEQEKVESVRAKWIKTFRYMKENVNTGNLEPVYHCDCPVCKWGTGNQGTRFNFCPNCGADMTGAKQ